jgi:PAS domain S-box-containing protein
VRQLGHRVDVLQRQPLRAYPFAGYAVAALAALAAFALRLGFISHEQTVARYSTFYLATIVTVCLAGRGPAMLSALLGWLLADYYFVAPRFEWTFWKGANLAWEALYWVVSATLIGAFDAQFKYRLRAETALDDLHRQLTLMRTITDNAADALFLLDSQGRTTFLNPAAEAMFGYSNSELLGQVLHDMTHYRRLDGTPLAAAECPMTLAISSGESLHGHEEVCFRKDGTPVQISLSSAPLRYDGGQVLGAVLVVVDMTEHKRLEAQVRQTQKLESIGLLAGGIAHDFNNILTATLGTASMAAERTADRAAQQAFAEIVQHTERAANLTRQLLAYAGKGRFICRLIDLTELVARAAELLRSAIPRKVELLFELAGGLPPVEADPNQIEQVLMNLAVNAGESIAPGAAGRVTVATRSGPGPYVCLEVRDNGCGMDEAAKARMFDPFFTTKFMGRGLGLAAVHGIVNACNGFIDVLSAPGVGTVMRVFLPVAEKPAAVPPVGRRNQQPQRVSGSVLVVDDEEPVRRLASRALQQCGYRVLEAGNGREALDVLEAASPRPAVVLLDLAMPVMSGEEALPLLLEKQPSLRVIVSSGYAEEEARQVFRAHVVAGFLQKPYTVDTLVESVAKAMG